MKTIKLAWNHLRILEKIMLFVATLISIGLSYQASRYGSLILSNLVIGPLVLMALAMQSLFMVGVIRMRSMAMNYMFVELLVELREAKGRLGETITPGNLDMITKFLGDE